MPTYTVTNSNFNLSPKQQKNLAEGITKVHNQVTGANTYFAQVIFNSTGILRTVQEEIVATRNGRIEVTSVNDTRTLRNSRSTTSIFTEDSNDDNVRQAFDDVNELIHDLENDGVDSNDGFRKVYQGGY